MNRKIVQTSGRSLLVGGAPYDTDMLQAGLARADKIVAADGGAGPILALGRVPDAVIGDMDSLDGGLASQIPAHHLHHIAEQDSTDFDKCLRNMAAGLIEGHGFLGGRLDHELSVLTVLVRRADQRVLLIGAEDVVTVAPRDLSLTLPAGTRVSLYPMASVAGRSSGLRWPIEDIAFAPDTRTGTSNVVTGPVNLQFDAPRMLLILPVTYQGVLEAALAEAPAWKADEAR